MRHVNTHFKRPPRPASAGTPDPASARSHLTAFVATVKSTVSAIAPEPAVANSVVVQPGGKTFSTIGAALNSITDASQKRQYVVSIGAGVYAEVVICKPWVFLNGALTGQTTITAGSQASPFNKGVVKAASNSALQNCAVEATTTGTPGDWVTTVECQGAVNFDIENCVLLAEDPTNQTNVTALSIDDWAESSGSQVNIAYSKVSAVGGASPLAIATGWDSFAHAMESRLIAANGGSPGMGGGAIDQSTLLVESCYVQGASFSLWQDDTGRITANQCQLHGPVGPGVVVNP